MRRVKTRRSQHYGGQIHKHAMFKDGKALRLDKPICANDDLTALQLARHLVLRPLYRQRRVDGHNGHNLYWRQGVLMVHNKGGAIRMELRGM